MIALATAYKDAGSSTIKALAMGPALLAPLIYLFPGSLASAASKAAKCATIIPSATSATRTGIILTLAFFHAPHALPTVSIAPMPRFA